MSSNDEELANAVTQNRGNTVMPQIEYRKMKALERIADVLEGLAPSIVKLANPPMTLVEESAALRKLRRRHEDENRDVSQA